MNWSSYLNNLPLVKTASLPMGVLFIASGKIYEVTDVQGDTYRKARQWRKDESTEVALVPNSSLARQLPVIDQGHLLPPIKSRNDLLQNGRYIIFIFPTEQNAIDCAYLDVALCGGKFRLICSPYGTRPRHRSYQWGDGVPSLLLFPHHTGA